MAKKRLIVCCDGTWNDADSGDEFTNVARMSWAILPTDTRGAEEIAQVVYYQSGVGTGDVFNKALGGGAGVGLSRNVRDAYGFIANNYCDGDEIFLFGFSRGAYTARSVGGLIGYAGLLPKRDMDRFAVLWESYRLRGKPGHVDPRPQFKKRHFPVRIKCIGVWDTVGSLGIPGHVDQAFTSFYEFHDTGLGAHVDNAFHALALDEARKDFQPTLWQQDPAAKANGQILRQVWFAGVHSNVGGGYDEHGLSDVTLAWMIGQVADMLAVDVDDAKEKRDLRNGWGLGRVYDSADSPIWKLRGTQARTPLAGNDATCESVHPSVAERSKRGGRLRAQALCQPGAEERQPGGQPVRPDAAGNRAEVDGAGGEGAHGPGRAQDIAPEPRPARFGRGIGHDPRNLARYSAASTSAASMKPPDWRRHNAA